MSLLDATRVTDEQRHEMIAIAAYYLAQQRDFAPGGEQGDWVQAERVIDAMLADWLAQGTRPASTETAVRNALRFFVRPDA